MLPGKPPTIWKFKKYSPKESNSQKKCQSKLEYILKLKMKNATYQHQGMKLKDYLRGTLIALIAC